MGKNIKRILIALIVNFTWFIVSMPISEYFFNWEDFSQNFLSDFIFPISPFILFAISAIVIIAKWETKKK